MRKLTVLFLNLMLLMAAMPIEAQIRRPAALNPSVPLLSDKKLPPVVRSRGAQQQGDPESLAGSGSGEVVTGYATPQTIVSNKAVSSTIPSLTAEQLRAREEREMEFEEIPVRPGAAVAAGPIEPPTYSAASAPVAAAGNLPLAPNDMTYFQTHNISSAEVPTSQRSTIQETSVINLGQTIFYTGNWYAARSTDGGNAFSYVNPYTLFPSINGGFCCDQVTAYAPNQDMAIWGLQYIKDGTSGTFRIARAIGSTGVANNNWVYYDFNPQQVGFASGNWYDFPSFTVGANYLYVTSNVFRTSDDVFTGSVILRLPLASLAAGTGFSYNSYTSTNLGSIRCTDGATTTMYCATFNTTTQMRIHRWDESSSTVLWDDVNLNGYTPLNRNGVATSPDGTNWAARADGRLSTAYRANGIIGLMFMARQDANFPYPYTIHARFNESTRALVSQGQIWNPNFAWLYPASSPNAAGRLAGTLQIGGGSQTGGAPYPGTQIWITDDVEPGTGTTVGAVYGVSAGNAGPSSNGWGDYFTVRPHKSFPNTWVASSHSLVNGQTGSSTVPNYTWFGRQRDGASTSCTYSINPTSTSIAAAGGTGSVAITTQAGCAWAAASNAAWISITSGSSGTGSGTLGYSVLSNSSSTARSGTVTIAGQTFTVNQSGTTAPPPPSAALHFYLLASPLRLLDTRPGFAACNSPGFPISAGTAITVPARTACTGIPSTAVALAGNVAVVNTLAGSAGGFLTLYKSNTPLPLAANINYAPGDVLNNFYTVGMGTDGAFNIYAFSTTHVVVDITGYYAP
jgi:hypothetical protein